MVLKPGSWVLSDVMLMPSPVTHITGFANGIEQAFISDCKTAFMERWDVDQCGCLYREGRCHWLCQCDTRFYRSW